MNPRKTFSRCLWCGARHERNSAFCSAECSNEHAGHYGDAVRIVEDPGEEVDDDVELDDDDLDDDI